MKTLLIVGGSGFFGKSFIDYFCKKKFIKWNISNLIVTSRSIKNINGIKTYRYNSEKDSTLPSADYIIYAASSTDPYVYRNKFHDEYAIQKKAMRNFKLAVSKMDKIPEKILYTSSGAVYGQKNLNNFNTEESVLCKPEDNTEEKKNYSIIKLEWENYLLENFSNNSLIARCFAFVGPNLRLNGHFAIGNFIDDYFNKNTVTVKNQGLVFRSYMYADDLVEWLLSVITKMNITDERIVNIGSDEKIEIHDLANKFNTLSGSYNKMYPVNKSSLDCYIPNVTFAKKNLNLYLKYNLDDAIQNTIEALTSKNLSIN